jgi:hypothetical protein
VRTYFGVKRGKGFVQQQYVGLQQLGTAKIAIRLLAIRRT